MTGPVKDLFAFALNLYRAPLQYRPYVGKNKPIPPGFSEFLDVLSKREGHEAWGEFDDIQGATIQELREAGFFLVKRILFVEDANHYRLFGLDPSTTTQEIRERYRLLIGLFHPDKMPFGDEWSELYAPKINDAYNILKNSDKRSRYDEDIGLHPPAIEQKTGPEPMYWGDAGKEPGSGSDFQDGWDNVSLVEDSPFHADSRELPEQDAVTTSSESVRAELPAAGSAGYARKLLFGLLILSGTGIALWYLLPVKDAVTPAVKPLAEAVSDNPHVPEATPALPAADSTQGPNSAALAEKGTDSIDVSPSALPITGIQTESRPEVQQPRPEPLVETQAYGPSPLAQAKEDIKTNPAAAKTSPALEQGVSRQLQKPAPKPVLPQVKTDEPAKQAMQSSPVVVSPIPAREMPKAQGPSHPVVVKTQPKDDKAAFTQSAPDASKLSESAERLEIKTEKQEVKRSNKYPEERIRQADIDYLLYRFVHSYQEGAIEDFTALFDVDALTNDGKGRDHIESSYGDLFSSSSKRSIRIKDVLWTSKDPMRADIAFLVEVWVESNSFLDASQYAGNADMRVELGNKGLLITEFLHQVTPK